MEGYASPSPYMAASTPIEKSSTISYGKTNITTMKTPLGPAKEVTDRPDSRTTMRISMKRKLQLPSAVPRRPDQIYDLHGRPLLLGDVGFASTANGMHHHSTLARRNGLATKRHSLMPELAAAQNVLMPSENDGSALSAMNKTQNSGFGAEKYNNLLKKKGSPRRGNARAPFPRHASTKRPTGYGNNLM